MSEIINKVAMSALVTIDLEEVIDRPRKRISIDVAKTLYQGLVLREKDFRLYVKDTDWNLYKDAYVNVHCSTDAIIPNWAYMLILSKLSGIAKLAIYGNSDDLEKEISRLNISEISLSDYTNAKVVIKGCAELKHPEFVFSEVTKHLVPVVSSMMYGEPCSTVPIYKKKR